MAKMPSGRRICILICSCFIFTTVWNVTNAFVNLLLDQLAYGREKFHSIIGQVKIFFLLQSQYFLFIFLHAAKLSTEWPNRHCKIFQNSCEIFHFYMSKKWPTLQILTFDPSQTPINKGKFSDRFFLKDFSVNFCPFHIFNSQICFLFDGWFVSIHRFIISIWVSKSYFLPYCFLNKNMLFAICFDYFSSLDPNRSLKSILMLLECRADCL